VARRPPARRTTTSAPQRDPTTAYARAVVKGRRPDGELAGEFEIAACRRHLDDLKNAKARGLRWDLKRAQHAINFYPALLTITDGVKVGEPFKLLPWHVFVAGSSSAGARRQRPHAVPFGLDRDRKRSGEVALHGGNRPLHDRFLRHSARESVRDRAGSDHGERAFQGRGRHVSRADPAGARRRGRRGRHAGRARPRGHPRRARQRVEDRVSGLGFGVSVPRKWRGGVGSEAHAGRGGRDPRIQVELVDRNLEKRDRQDARRCTDAPRHEHAGERSDRWHQLLGVLPEGRQGELFDDEAFAFIARVDKADRETVLDNPACWPKALPALGITFPIENIEGMVNTAKQLLSTAMSTKRLYFGIPVGATEFWIAEEAWLAVQGKVDVLALKGRKCWLSLDLSDKNDLTALTAVWIGEDGHLYAKTWYWTVKERLKERSLADKAPYVEWVEGKLITGVDGAVIDKTFVAAEVQAALRRARRSVPGVRSRGHRRFHRRLRADRLPRLEIRGARQADWLRPQAREPCPGQTGPVRGQAADDAAVDRAPRGPHPRQDDHHRDLSRSPTAAPQTRISTVDGQGNRAFDKKRSRGRIDGLVTIAMGVGAATNELGDDGSVYDDKDILVV
jgi:hypothetical protein